MPKCPRCGEEIDCLINISEAIQEYVFTLDSEGFARYEQTDEWGGDWNVWECPECREELFYNEKDATKFLNGR